MILKSLIVMCCVLGCRTAHAQSDIFIQAVKFALTGSDSSLITVINRKDCIFGIGRDVVHLNNVHADRIGVNEWVESSAYSEPRTYVTVDLRGEGTVYEEFKAGLIKNEATEEIVKELQKTDPTATNLFKSKMRIHSEYRLRLDTNEKERVIRAWSYVYQNGCTGKKNPF